MTSHVGSLLGAVPPGADDTGRARELGLIGLALELPAALEPLRQALGAFVGLRAGRLGRDLLRLVEERGRVDLDALAARWSGADLADTLEAAHGLWSEDAPRLAQAIRADAARRALVLAAARVGDGDPRAAGDALRALDQLARAGAGT